NSCRIGTTPQGGLVANRYAPRDRPIQCTQPRSIANLHVIGGVRNSHRIKFKIIIILVAVSKLKTGRGIESRARSGFKIENNTGVKIECGIGIRIESLFEIEIQKMKELFDLGLIHIRIVIGRGSRIENGTGNRIGNGNKITIESGTEIENGTS
ncbi:hypothetical protein EVAR_24974_1, partial [Eumeta japonica]